MLLGPMSQYMPNAPLSLSGSQDVAVVVTPGDSSTLQASVLTPPEPRGDQATPGAGLATELHVVPAPALRALAAAGLDAQLLQPDGRLEPCVPGWAMGGAYIILVYWVGWLLNGDPEVGLRCHILL